MDFDLVTTHQNRMESKAEPFGLYHSPLLLFKSYRCDDVKHRALFHHCAFLLLNRSAVPGQPVR